LISDDTIRCYFLGTLDEEECQRVEECLISDRDFFEQAMIAEDELIDEYLDGRLSDSEKKRFVIHFLVTPRQRQKLKRARAIKRFVNDELVSTEPPEIVRYSKKLSFWWRRALGASS
jgi:anti-sigma factor RsiW